MSATQVQTWLGDAIKRVVAILVSHPDADHNNYLPRMFKDHVFETNGGVIYAGKKEQYSDIMKLWFEAWEYLKKLYTVGTVNSQPSSCINNCVVSSGTDTNFCGGQTIQFKILAANVGSWKNPNEQSIVMKIIVGQWSMLLPGDIEGKASKTIATEAAADLKSVVYKVSHHGASSKANLLEWLIPIEPKSSFISSAYGYYLHPRCDTIGRLLLMASITGANPHDFYCGYGGGYNIYQYGVLADGFKHNMWETSPSFGKICLLTYKPTNINDQPVVECLDNDDDNADDECNLRDIDNNCT